MNDADRASVERLAHEIWVRRGRQPGRALEDWLEAERQFRAKHAAEAAAKAHAAAHVPVAPPAPPPPRAPSPPAVPAAKKKKRR